MWGVVVVVGRSQLWVVVVVGGSQLWEVVVLHTNDNDDADVTPSGRFDLQAAGFATTAASQTLAVFRIPE